MAFEISENKGSSKISVDVDMDFIFAFNTLFRVVKKVTRWHDQKRIRLFVIGWG